MSKHVLILTILYFFALLASPLGCKAETSVEAVVAQVRGSGCQYDSNCNTHWSWWQKVSIRHPEYACRMRAAACLGRLGANASSALPDLLAARTEMPEQFDTGDGVLGYLACIDAAIVQIKQETKTADLDIIKCGF